MYGGTWVAFQLLMHNKVYAEKYFRQREKLILHVQEVVQNISWLWAFQNQSYNCVPDSGFKFCLS